jgi:hypothetical protein
VELLLKLLGIAGADRIGRLTEPLLILADKGESLDKIKKIIQQTASEHLKKLDANLALVAPSTFNDVAELDREFKRISANSEFILIVSPFGFEE